MLGQTSKYNQPKKAYIVPHMTICKELACGLIATSPSTACELNATKGSVFDDDDFGVTSCSKNFYTPYSDQDDSDW